MEERNERKVWPQRGWVHLRGLGMTSQRSRPRQTKADPLAQRRSRKLPSILRRVHREHLGARVELWAENEARLGLRPATYSASAPLWAAIFGSPGRAGSVERLRSGAESGCTLAAMKAGTGGSRFVVGELRCPAPSVAPMKPPTRGRPTILVSRRRRPIRGHVSPIVRISRCPWQDTPRAGIQPVRRRTAWVVVGG